MLNRLEAAYLGLLRVVILIVATIALVVAAIGLVSAVPPLLRWMGVTETEKPTGGTLGEFIEEQKLSETTAAPDAAGRSERLILPDVQASARTVVAYLGKRAAIDEHRLESGLQDNADAEGANELAYATSLRDLTDQLPKSRGKPLTGERVVQLLEWHKGRFDADVTARAARQSEANARFWLVLGGSGAAFLAFVLVIFVFLFVRVERSLRTLSAAPVLRSEPIVSDAVA